MPIDNIVGGESVFDRWINNPIERGFEPFRELSERRIERHEKVRDYIDVGKKMGANIGKYTGIIAGAVLPFLGGWYVGDYFSELLGYFGGERTLFNSGSAVAAGVGLLPYTLRGFVRIGASLGSFVGGIVGGIYGGFRKLFG